MVRKGESVMRFTRRGGFTLIELLIVIAIILILIAIALPNFLEAQIRAKVVRVKSDQRTIHTAMEAYLQDWDMYPPRSEDEFRPGANGLMQLTTPLKYLPEIPFDVFVGGGEPVDNSPLQTPVFWEMASTGLTRNLAAAGLRPFRNIHAFALYSHGPKVIDMFHGEGDWPWGGSANQCGTGVYTTSYSATNGSRSFGNILEFGGSWRSGHWCLDNVEIIGAFADHRGARHNI
jgi:prepilin-type N-terminal cleavage/methylation domain-containing protein